MLCIPSAISLVDETRPLIVVGLPKLTEHAVVQEIAAKHGPNTTTAQILIAWGAYRGFSVIPKSVQESGFLIYPLDFMVLFFPDTLPSCMHVNSGRAT